jgi:hypothetical protein
MPTEAITKNAPVNIAEKEGKQSILAFDKEGKIDVFLFDDIESLTDSFGIDKSLQIPLSELANANILFQICDQIKLMPGESEKDDQAIIDRLKSKISDNITNPLLITSEIMASWEKIACHPLFKRYEAFKESKEKTTLAYIGAYEASLHDYIAGYLATLIQHESIEKWIFAQTAELVKSTFDGRGFLTHSTDKMNTLLSLSEECTDDIPYSRKTFDNIKVRLEASSVETLQAPTKKDLLSLAHSNQPADAELLLMTLLDDNQHVSPKLLQSIAKTSKNESIIDLSTSLLQLQQREEASEELAPTSRFTASFDRRLKEKKPNVVINNEKGQHKDKKKKVVH